MREFKLEGMPVWVYSKDIDTNWQVAPSRLIQGAVGDAYQVEPAQIEHYQFVRVDGPVTGIFNDEMRTVTFYYRQAEYAETEQLSSKYLQINSQTSTYTRVEGEPDGATLFPGTIVKVVQRVATKDGQFWYQLADSRWLPYSMKTMRLRDDDGIHRQRQADWNRPTTWQPKPFQHAAIVDYVPSQDIAVYRQPYGREIGRLVHGARVEISERVDDPSGVVWYHVEKHGFVPSVYLKLV